MYVLRFEPGCAGVLIGGNNKVLIKVKRDKFQLEGNSPENECP